MRSNASAGIIGPGCGFCSRSGLRLRVILRLRVMRSFFGAPVSGTWRARAARPPDSIARTLASFLSTCAVEDMRAESGRWSAGDRYVGTSNKRREVLPNVKLGILAAGRKPRSVPFSSGRAQFREIVLEVFLERGMLIVAIGAAVGVATVLSLVGLDRRRTLRAERRLRPAWLRCLRSLLVAFRPDCRQPASLRQKPPHRVSWHPDSISDFGASVWPTVADESCWAEAALPEAEPSAGCGPCSLDRCGVRHPAACRERCQKLAAGVSGSSHCPRDQGPKTQRDLGVRISLVSGGGRAPGWRRLCTDFTGV